MKQKLTHWIDKSLKNKILQGQFTQKINEETSLLIIEPLKPEGFWLSVNGSWERWIEGNWDSWLIGKVCLRTIIAKDINLFIIESKEQFLREFKELTGKDYMKLGIVEKWRLSDFHRKLKEKYDGVWLKEDPFYKHRLNIDFPYFYSWDCESICVWNKDKIKFQEMKNGSIFNNNR